MPSDAMLAELFGKPIFTYTRADAIRDGVLIDVTETAKEAGFLVPLALSNAAWEDCVAWTAEYSKRQVHQDQTGRLWDVLNLAQFRLKQATKAASGQLGFSVLRVPRDGKTTRPVRLYLKLHSGAGDNGEHVLTILLPHED
jgi:hypothetical protein